ncbi:hypothetical protein OH76DRAFT_943969 [Lentinus brumalis]|uniref:Uncharacterized protein n=1 Tax=Lentinus brumalis TaxID=2498619 RepID=A0A371CZ35_9APHY|nr:hypothetical protein OH76DRAFT_943969 [Polyporus brumalis]
MQDLQSTSPAADTSCIDGHALTPEIYGKLLPEILIHVFRLISPDRRRDIQLTHVCRLWRQLIHFTPEFWVDMLAGFDVQPIWTGPNAQEDPAFFFTLVRRTSSRPYSLSLRARNAPLLQRIRAEDVTGLVSLTIHSCPDIPIFLSLRLPALRSLKIIDHDIPVISDSSLASGLNSPRSDHFPTLTEVDVPTALFLPALAVPSLRRLTISGTMHRPDVFQRAIRECNLLDSLTIYDSPLLKSHLPTPSKSAVHLPHLSTLVLYGGHAPSENPALQLLSYPTPARVRMTLYGYGQSLLDVFPSIRDLQSSRTGSPVDHLVCKCTMNNEYGWLGQSIPNMTLAVSGYVEGTQTIAVAIEPSPWSTSPGAGSLCGPSVVLQDIVALFSTSKGHLQQLDFHFDHPIAVTKDDWALVLHAFPCIKSLSVRINSCLNLLMVLRTEIVSSDLESLSIEHSNGRGMHELLVTTIEGRAARGNPRLRKLACHHIPRPGEKTTVPALSKARIARLKAVVDALSVDVHS